jgi:hypothetical protein
MQTNFRLLRKDADHERFHFVVGEAGVEVLQLRVPKTVPGHQLSKALPHDLIALQFG